MTECDPARADDDLVLELIAMAGEGASLGDLAACFSITPVEVIEALYEHRDLFGPVYLQ